MLQPRAIYLSHEFHSWPRAICQSSSIATRWKRMLMLSTTSAMLSRRFPLLLFPRLPRLFDLLLQGLSTMVALSSLGVERLWPPSVASSAEVEPPILDDTTDTNFFQPMTRLWTSPASAPHLAGSSPSVTASDNLSMGRQDNLYMSGSPFGYCRAYLCGSTGFRKRATSRP